MRLILQYDTVEEVRRWVDFGLVQGVLFRPEAWNSTRRDAVLGLAGTVDELICALSAQHGGNLMEQAERYLPLSAKLSFSLPFGEEGLRTARSLKQVGVAVCFHSISLPEQGVAAAFCGAEGVFLPADWCAGDPAFSSSVKLLTGRQPSCRVIADRLTRGAQLADVFSAGATGAVVTASLLESLWEVSS